MNFIDSSYTFIDVDDHTTMALYVARPAATTNSNSAPTLIVLQEAFGLNNHIRDVAERFAREGYLAVAPELFHRTAPHGFSGNYVDMASVIPHARAITADTLSADLNATLQWLRADPQADAERIAAIGYCLGGRAAFYANSIMPLRAAVSYYGSGIDPALSAQQHGPLLLVWGGRDQHIDLTKRHAIGDALRDAGKLFIELEFSDAEHGFFCDERTSYNENAAREAWALTLAFLRNRLA